MQGISDALKSGILLFDGSMGALLNSMGYISDCPELYNVDKPEIIMEIHKRYIDSGAQVIITNSLGATPVKLAHKGISERAYELSYAAVKNAREAAEGRALVAFDLGPTGEFMEPVGDYTLEDFIGCYAVAVKAAKDAGADFVILETMTDIAECRAACIAAREAGLDVVASFTFDKGCRLLTGGTAECAALALEAVGAAAMGINCSGGPLDMIEPLSAMRRVSPLRVVVQPNAGLPKVLDDGSTVYAYTPESMTPHMLKILDAGASAIGGCCGTTPGHIRAFSGIINREVPPAVWDGIVRLCSARECITKEEALAAMVQITDIEDLYDLEEEDRCALIDISSLKPQEAAELVREAQGMTRKPLAFRVNHAETLAAALRAYCGVAGVYAPEDCTCGIGFVRL